MAAFVIGKWKPILGAFQDANISQITLPPSRKTKYNAAPSVSREGVLKDPKVVRRPFHFSFEICNERERDRENML